jgi:hypothetical protein
MAYFYFDESIHERGGFILGAFVCTLSDITPVVFQCIQKVGLRPGIDEFKSSARMAEDAVLVSLRDELKGLFSLVQLGLVILPSDNRATLAESALWGLKKIVESNGLSNRRHGVYFDQGISTTRIEHVITETTLGNKCDFFFDQDSKAVGGIQLADLYAHTMSVMLLAELGLVSKTVKAGVDSGYDPNLDIDLAFELWASVRYSLFTRDRIDAEKDPIEGFTVDTGSYALYLDPSCPSTLKEAATRRFGRTYLGCIH